MNEYIFYSYAINLEALTYSHCLHYCSFSITSCLKLKIENKFRTCWEPIEEAVERTPGLEDGNAFYVEMDDCYR